MTEGNNPPCETCAERGRERPGVHLVGSGWLCNDCWSGKGTREECAIGDTSPSVQAARRRYQEKNRAKLAKYQRLYRRRRARAGNQILYEAGPNAVQAAPGP
jgi:hypothetical protein